jgi:cell division protein ZapA
MAETKPGIKVEIFGNEYRIKGQADAEYVRQVAAYVDEKMRQIAQMSATGAVSKIAILTAINIADELFRERLERQRSVEELSQRLEQIGD